MELIVLVHMLPQLDFDIRWEIVPMQVEEGGLESVEKIKRDFMWVSSFDSLIDFYCA